MTNVDLIFSETMRLVAAEIGDKKFKPEEVEALFEKYHPSVKALYSKHQPPQFLTTKKL